MMIIIQIMMMMIIIIAITTIAITIAITTMITPPPFAGAPPSRVGLAPAEGGTASRPLPEPSKSL